jgi:hypothetical protein
MVREALNLCPVFAAGGACASRFVGEQNRVSTRFGCVAIQPNLNTRKFAYRDRVVVLFE